MGRDYAARNRRPASRAAGLPGWVWLVAGLSMGLIVACIVYIGRPAQPMPMVAGAGSAGGDAGTRKPRTKVEIPPVEEPRFDFYTLLETEQVVVPGESRPRPPTKTPARPVPPAAPTPPAPTAGVAPPPAPAATAPSGGPRYLVLAGSFRDLQNAEAHRAKLALVGVEARIETVRTQEGDTLHRVRIGPAGSREQAQGIASRLSAQGFDSRVLTMP
jgi:cell division protein FtsN